METPTQYTVRDLKEQSLSYIDYQFVPSINVDNSDMLINSVPSSEYALCTRETLLDDDFSILARIVASPDLSRPDRNEILAIIVEQIIGPNVFDFEFLDRAKGIVDAMLWFETI